jgi:competence protein ComGC
MTRRRHLRAEDGFTLVEVVIAAAIGIVIVLAIANTLDKSILNSLGHQRQAATVTIAQREVEKVRQIVKQYGFDSLAMSGATGAPTAGALAASPTDPDDFVTGYGGASPAFKIMEDYHNTAVGVTTGTPSAGEPLIRGGFGSYTTITGHVDPSTTGVTSGGVTATVYRYVTRRTEACLTASACDGDSRRVTIAVVPTNNPTTELQVTRPFYFSTVFNNPIPKDADGQLGSGLRIGVNIG